MGWGVQSFGLITTVCSEVTASGFLPGALLAMERWDLQVLLVSKVLLGCQDILGQRNVMDNAVLETVWDIKKITARRAHLSRVPRGSETKTTDKTWNQRPEDFKPESQSVATFSSIVLNKNPLYLASSLNTCGMWIIKLHRGLFFNAPSFLNVSSLFYSLIFHLSHFSFVHFQTTLRSWQDSFCFL